MGIFDEFIQGQRMTPERLAEMNAEVEAAGTECRGCGCQLAPKEIEVCDKCIAVLNGTTAERMTVEQTEQIRRHAAPQPYDNTQVRVWKGHVRALLAHLDAVRGVDEELRENAELIARALNAILTGKVFARGPDDWRVKCDGGELHSERPDTVIAHITLDQRDLREAVAAVLHPTDPARVRPAT